MLGLKRLALTSPLILLALFGALSPFTAHADIIQSVADTVSPELPLNPGEGPIQILGTNLSGTLTRASFQIQFQRSQAYGPLFIFDVSTCTDATYTSCNTIQSSASSDVSPQGDSQTFTPATVTFDLSGSPLSFDPTKYYKIKLTELVGGVYSGQFIPVGSAADTYPYGYSDIFGINDIAFSLQGITYSGPLSPPAPALTPPVILLHNDVIESQSDSSVEGMTTLSDYHAPDFVFKATKNGEVHAVSFVLSNVGNTEARYSILLSCYSDLSTYAKDGCSTSTGTVSSSYVRILAAIPANTPKTRVTINLDSPMLQLPPGWKAKYPSVFSAKDFNELIKDHYYEVFIIPDPSVHVFGTRNVSSVPGFQSNSPGWEVNLGISAPYFSIEGIPATPVVVPPVGPSSVMFLPGIEASRLYRPDYNGVTDRLWEPSSDADAQELGLDQTGKSVRDDIYTRDVMDTAYAPSGPNIYSSFITSMNTMKASPTGIADWEAIPYDWRLSLDDILTNGRNIDGRIYYAGPLGATSTPYIVQELRRLAATSKSGKVTVIAHSNGGLVAKRLTQVLGATLASQLIDKIIFVDVPQLGTPMAVAALLHGTDQGIKGVLSEKTARLFAQNSPMTYNLLPSSQYFTQTDDAVITFDPAKLPEWATKYGDVHSTEREQSFILDTARIQPTIDDIKTPEIGNPSLYSASNATHASLDAWTPPSGVKLYLINGWGVETLSSIAYTKVPTCTTRSLFGFCTSTYSDTLTIKPTHVVDGDGTVVESSAMWANGVTDAQRYWVNLRDFNSFLKNPCVGKYCKDHKNILEVGELRELIQNMLLGNNVVPADYITTSAPTAKPNDTRLHFILHSPLSLGFTDTFGNYSGAQGNIAVFNTPNVTYERYGDIQWLSIPKTLAGKVILHGEASGTFSLAVEEQTGNSIVSATSFEGIPSATSTIAQFVLDGNTSPTSAGTLQVDYDGNGTTDYSLSSKLGGVVMPPTKPLILTPVSKVITLGAPLPSLTYTVSGFVDGDTVTTSTSGSASCTTTATPTSPIGTYPIICTQGTLVSGKYYVTNTVIGTLRIVYRFDGFLQPINDTAHQIGQNISVFKAGSTVPVKLQLKNASGALQQGVTAPLWLTPQKGSAMSASIDETVYADPATTGTAFKWDAITQQYQYNWNTKGFTAGYWYKISVKSPDNTVYMVTVGLK